MSNQPESSPFSSTRQDLSNLKTTATDAAKDLRSTASVHTEKAKGELKDLAGHVQEEGLAQINEAKGQLVTVTNAARDFISARPFSSIGIAVIAGFLIGLSRRVE